MCTYYHPFNQHGLFQKIEYSHAGFYWKVSIIHVQVNYRHVSLFKRGLNEYRRCLERLFKRAWKAISALSLVDEAQH